MIFLGWDRPLLTSAAAWLLDGANVPSTPDFSRLLVVVRGRRAGRRLLELLALESAARGVALVPPEIITPSQLVLRLTKKLPGELTPASPLASALAWATAIRNTPESERNHLFRRPGVHDAEPGLRQLFGLGHHLHGIWRELGGAGLGFADVIRTLGERFPHIADFEIPRWEVLTSLHQQAGKILRQHGLIDATDHQISRAHRGEIDPERQVVLVGVSEMARIVLDFLARLPKPPTALVFAPESEGEGFIEPGLLCIDYWQKRPARLEAGQIHLVERDRDQALRVALMMQSWHDSGVARSQITVAVPEPGALHRLRETLESQGFKTRWAEGRPAADSPSFQLLRRVAAYLDRAPGEPPRFAAVADLVRHPDLDGLRELGDLGPGEWTALDAFATDHFPLRFDPDSVTGASESARRIRDQLDRFVAIAADDTTPHIAADAILRLLVRVYGAREENALGPAGRVAIHGLELLRDVLANTAFGLIPWPERVRPADFLHIVLGFLGDQTAPEPPNPAAIELVGWLELADDDAPAAIVTSFFEGAVPETTSADPFLPGSLRDALGLGDNANRLARDASALAALIASRSRGRGAVSILAPRFDSADQPVRPSRLLLNGLQGDALARRVWHLSGRRSSELLPAITEGPGFGAVSPVHQAQVERIRVTAFRDYLESPRKFYFRHVLHLDAQDDNAVELQERNIGILIHEVLAAFGTAPDQRGLSDATAISACLAERFDELARSRFGRWAQPAIEIQAGEIRRRLLGFAAAQAKLRHGGWAIHYVEGARQLTCKLPGFEENGTLTLSGKIDRIDFNPNAGKWRILDYKTSAKRKDPLRTHYLSRSRKWIDLQLPLYLKLASPLAWAEWGVELNPENCELLYFQLPENDGLAGPSEPFPPDLIGEAWDEAARIVDKILRGEFEDNPTLRSDPTYNDPALLALCGQVGLVAPEPGANEFEGTGA